MTGQANPQRELFYQLSLSMCSELRSLPRERRIDVDDLDLLSVCVRPGRVLVVIPELVDLRDTRREILQDERTAPCAVDRPAVLGDVPLPLERQRHTAAGEPSRNRVVPIARSRRR